MKFFQEYLAILLLYVVEIQSLKQVNFSLIVSYGEFGFNSSGAIAAVDLALMYINTSTQLLPDYELRHSAVKNSKVRTI